MASIEIDFDVYKELTLRRQTESTTYNDVLRELLGLDAETGEHKSDAPTNHGAVYQGILLPEGTQFRVSYKGRTYRGCIKNGKWVDEGGRVRRSPSEAASAITRTNVNGWRFWDFKRPEDSEWRRMRVLQGI